MAVVNDKMNPRSNTPNEPRAAKTISLSSNNPNLVSEQSESNTGFFSSFFGSKKKKTTVMEAPPAVLKATGASSEREQMEIEVIKLLIQSYYNIVKRTVMDMIPKAIMFNLVFTSKEGLQAELLKELYKSDFIEDMLKESEFTRSRRDECKKMIEVNLTKVYINSLLTNYYYYYFRPCKKLTR
jgi:dynamin 1-like protein